jgi:hypothetical protein
MHNDERQLLVQSFAVFLKLQPIPSNVSCVLPRESSRVNKDILFALNISAFVHTRVHPIKQPKTFNDAKKNAALALPRPRHVGTKKLAGKRPGRVRHTGFQLRDEGDTQCKHFSTHRRAPYGAWRYDGQNMSNSRGLLTEIARTHLGVSLGCLAATSVFSVYQYITGKRDDLCGSLMMSAVMSLAYPIVVAYATVLALSDWRNSTQTTWSASFKTRVTSNKT